MRRPGIGVLALTLGLLGAAGLLAGMLWLGPRNGSESLISEQGVGGVLLLAAFLSAGVVGGVVAWRRPRNPVGWLFLAVFVLIGLMVYAEEHATYALVTAPGVLPGGLLAAWFAHWAWYPAIGAFIVFVPLLFPTGRPPSPRWRLIGWTGGIALTTVTVNSALSERLVGELYDVANPLGIPGVVAEQGLIDGIGLALATAAIVGAVASIVVRFRRSEGEERQQLKWFTFAAALLPLTVAVEYVPLPLVQQLGDALFALVIALLPLAAGLAILRHRLYDIDRIISRTVSYALLSVLLATVYATGVVVLGQLLAPVAAGSDLAVAAATLVAAALFSPARRRIQAVVDRRFNRARYDAQRELEAFRGRLRHEVDLALLGAELVAVVERTVQPGRAALWIRGGEGRR